MKIRMAILILFISNFLMAQDFIPWKVDSKISLNDFAMGNAIIDSSLSTYSYSSGCQIEFAYQMSNYEYMFTKNFNDKIACNFYTNSAIINAVDSAMAKDMINFAQYEFDLTELYARRIRQEIYVEKGAFSDASFLQSVFMKWQQTYNAEKSKMLNSTNFGRNADVLNTEHKKVKEGILSLSDFCKSCKPKKKKKP